VIANRNVESPPGFYNRDDSGDAWADFLAANVVVWSDAADVWHRLAGMRGGLPLRTLARRRLPLCCLALVRCASEPLRPRRCACLQSTLA
jgi:hypothetical protein